MKKRKITSVFLALGLFASLLFQVPISAEEADQSAAVEASGTISTNSISGWPQASDISSEAAVVMENTTNTILYSKNADEVLFPGSTVKIMTCLLALENTQLTDEGTMTATGVSGVTDGGASISSQVDEVFTVEQCLYAIMVASANDIALQIAEHVGGSVDGFVQQMNTRAQELGCTNTVFTNPTGLPDDNQHTTAHDMALIMQAAIQNESFRTIAAATSYTIPATNKAAARNLTSKFTMTDTGSTGFYEGCIGGKEGYTEASGSTLVCAAQRNGMTLISVVLKGASGQTAPDAASILNYGLGCDQFFYMTGKCILKFRKDCFPIRCLKWINPFYFSERHQLSGCRRILNCIVKQIVDRDHCIKCQFSFRLFAHGHFTCFSIQPHFMAEISKIKCFLICL